MKTTTLINSKEIILDDSLIILEEDFKEYNFKRFFGDIKGFEAVTKIDAQITHRNYLDYLSLCWKRHYGVIISPTIFWNMLLNNLAFEVNKNPDKYRKYFTETEEKQEICVQQGGNLISPELLIGSMRGYVPSDIMDHTFPSYSTDTKKSQIANYTAFLDMVSPYYNYSMYLCGIPKVKVLGTKEDWELFYKSLIEIAAIIPKFKKYLVVVGKRILSIIDDACEYSGIFSLERCGSGSQVEVSGWIKEFFIEKPSVTYPENFVSCISKIDYHNYNDSKDYRLYAGLFTSKIDDGYLVPDFDCIYFVNNLPK